MVIYIASHTKYIVPFSTTTIERICQFSGGVSTSLLFSVFESWYVREHSDGARLPASMTSATFGASMTGNGLIAIAAGVAANAVTGG